MSEYYAYALGYYAGRANGVEEYWEKMSALCKSKYKEGYEQGISDYCHFELGEE